MPAPIAKQPILTFTGMTDMGLKTGFDLSFHINDNTAQVYLHVETDANRVLITGTTRLTRRDAVLAAIDATEKWGQTVKLWMTAEKAGARVAETGKVPYTSHVKPYSGPLTIGGFSRDTPALTYPGIGTGRVLSGVMNGKRYFTHAGKLETSNAMRGFDCTTFPLALYSVSLPPPGYGKQLGEALGAMICNLEQVSPKTLKQHFDDDDIPLGQYILFSEGHVLLYNSDINTLYEFNLGGFKATFAPLRSTEAKNGLWWMRKLPESRRPQFSMI